MHRHLSWFRQERKRLNPKRAAREAGGGQELSDRDFRSPWPRVARAGRAGGLTVRPWVQSHTRSCTAAWLWLSGTMEADGAGWQAVSGGRVAQAGCLSLSLASFALQGISSIFPARRCGWDLCLPPSEALCFCSTPDLSLWLRWV